MCVRYDVPPVTFITAKLRADILQWCYNFTPEAFGNLPVRTLTEDLVDVKLDEIISELVSFRLVPLYKFTASAPRAVVETHGTGPEFNLCLLNVPVILW